MFNQKLSSSAEHLENFVVFSFNIAVLSGVPQSSGSISTTSTSLFKKLAPVRCIFKILNKIALPRGASSRVHRFSFKIALSCGAEHLDSFDENCAPVRSILKISLFVYLKSNSRAELSENLE